MTASPAGADEDAADHDRADLVEPAAQFLDGPAPRARRTGDDDHAVHLSRDGEDIGGDGRRMENRAARSRRLRAGSAAARSWRRNPGPTARAASGSRSGAPPAAWRSAPGSVTPPACSGCRISASGSPPPTSRSLRPALFGQLEDLRERRAAHVGGDQQDPATRLGQCHAELGGDAAGRDVGRRRRRRGSCAGFCRSATATSVARSARTASAAAAVRARRRWQIAGDLTPPRAVPAVAAARSRLGGRTASVGAPRLRSSWAGSRTRSSKASRTKASTSPISRPSRAPSTSDDLVARPDRRGGQRGADDAAAAVVVVRQRRKPVCWRCSPGWSARSSWMASRSWAGDAGRVLAQLPWSAA